MFNQELSLSPALAQVIKRIVASQQQIARARPQVDLQCIAQWLKNFPEEANRIGDSGWTIPMWASLAEVSHILESATQRQIDDVFLDYYQADGGANYRSLKLYLRRRESLSQWRPLIEQCFTAFECGHYLIVVPAMITVIEGAIAKVGGAEAWLKKDPKQTAKKLVGSLPKNSIKRIIWLSVDAFVSHLFEQRSFADMRSPLINRPWILHGRDELLWNKADCLRLFQAADTIGV